MRRKGLLLLVLALIISIFWSGTALGAADDQLVRVGGGDRYETAAKSATDTFSSAEEVVIARGDLLVDGLVASFLAGELDAPILLTPKDKLHEKTKEALKKLGAEKVHLVGGTEALSTNVEKALEREGYKVNRIPGANRIETSLNVAGYAGGSFDRVYIVNGDKTADAMIAGSQAYEQGIPIIVDRGQKVSTPVGQALQKWGVKEAVIVGGTAVVSSSYESALQSMGIKVDRAGGKNRYETALVFAQQEHGNNIQSASLVNGADAHLVDAIGAAYHGDPVLFVENEKDSSHNSAVIEFVKKLFEGNLDLQVYIFGGYAALGQELEALIKEGIADALRLKIESVTMIDRDTLEVTFAQKVARSQSGEVQFELIGPFGYQGTASGTVQAGDLTATLQTDKSMARQGYYTLVDVPFFVGDGELVQGELEHAGYERTYEVYIPSSYDGSTPVPLLFSFHGMGGTSAGQINSSGYTDIAEEEGFIAVFPNSTRLTDAGEYQQYIPQIPLEIAGAQWDPGIGIALQYYYNVDDVGFISKLIDKLVDEYNIDTNRIYATGHSSGGMFMYNLAIHLADKLTAVAAVASPMTLGLKDKEPANPITVIQVMGNEDEIIPFEGGPDNIFRALPGQPVWFSFYESGKFWADKNGITSEPTQTRIGDNVVKTVYTGGADGTEVILYEIEGGSHAWPHEEEINSQVIWDELSRFARNQ